MAFNQPVLTRRIFREPSQHQPVWYEFPLPAGVFRAELIDPVAGMITPVAGTHSGKAAKLRLVVKPYQAVRFKLVS